MRIGVHGIVYNVGHNFYYKWWLLKELGFFCYLQSATSYSPSTTCMILGALKEPLISRSFSLQRDNYWQVADVLHTLLHIHSLVPKFYYSVDQLFLGFWLDYVSKEML